MKSKRPTEHLNSPGPSVAHITGSGIDMEIVGNGLEAMVCLRENIGDRALVCSDVEMPGASDSTLLEWVRTFHPAIPMIRISGVDDENFPREATRRGEGAAFRKPFKIAVLQQTVAAIFPWL